MDSPVSSLPRPDAPSPGPGDPGPRLLPSPISLDCYELRAVIGEGSAGIVYLGTDRTLRAPVAVREYMPHGLAARHGASRVVPLSAAHETAFARGLQAFIDEARTLARCDHPSLLRIVRLLEANGTAYSVMPHYVGRPLTDVRRDANGAFDEDQLRALLGDLLGALEAFHASGRVHGGVSPDNVLLLQNGRPLLLRPRAQGRGMSGGPIDTLTGYLHARDEAASIGAATGAWMDVRDAARVIRFLMDSGWAGHPAAAADGERSASDGVDVPLPLDPSARYSRSFLEALDAAESLLPERRPRSVAEFRAWLDAASPSQSALAGARPHDGDAPAEDLFVRDSQPSTAPPAFASGAPEFPEPERAPAPETTSDFHPAPTRSDRDARSRRLALKIAVLLGMVAVPTIAIWFLNRPPVAIHGWSKALVPPSLTPSRNASQSDATRVATLPEAAPQASSGALESAGAVPETASRAARNAAPMVGDAAAEAAPILSPTTPAPATSAPAEPALVARPEVAPAPASPAVPEAPPRSPVTAPPVLQVSPKQGSPREVCAPRTQFALYRCMQTQCSTPRWSNHAQCIRLRATDEVE